MIINYYNPYVRDELCHHGIFGMRWGKRNGPPYPLGASDHSASEKKAGWRKSLDGGGQTRREARKYTRKLNRLDKNQVESLARYQRASDKANRIERKHGSESEKYQKAASKAANFEKKLKESEAETWRTIAELSEKGYSMESKKVQRMALMGESIAAQALGGVLANAIVSTLNSKYSVQEGNKFKVRKTTENEAQSAQMELHRNSTSDFDGNTVSTKSTNKQYDNDSSNKAKTSNDTTSKNDGSGSVYTQKEMQEKITTARNKDRWDLEFLERYNPDDYYQEWNQADAIKEYKKYLKDPYKYHYEPPTATNKF